MKGFVHEDRNRDFDDHCHIYYEEYTQLYNTVYRALKSFDPTLQVGGFYPVFQGSGTEKGGYYSMKPITPNDREAMMYWLEHKEGADFFCADRGMSHYWDDSPATDDEIMDTACEFGNIMRQIQEVCDLPIWWSEYYFAGKKGSRYADAAAASLHYHVLMAGGETRCLLWNPIDTEGLNAPLFTDPDNPLGGTPTSYYRIFRAFNTHFAEGRTIYAVENTGEKDLLCAASDTATVIINKRDRSFDIELNGEAMKLEPYDVVIIEK